MAAHDIRAMIADSIVSLTLIIYPRCLGILELVWA
jgi:hypothetical protein